MFKLLATARRYLIGTTQFENYYSNLITVNAKGFPNFTESKLDFKNTFQTTVITQIN